MPSERRLERAALATHGAFALGNPAFPKCPCRAQPTEGMAMKYMLMMNTPRGEDYQVMSWPKEDMEAHIAFMIGFAQKLGAAGELVGAEGLASASRWKLVRTDEGG